eukprot:scaffold115_cov304-Prasinococcus_capsulatus_cf.AAC.59
MPAGTRPTSETATGDRRNATAGTRLPPAARRTSAGKAATGPPQHQQPHFAATYLAAAPRKPTGLRLHCARPSIHPCAPALRAAIDATMARQGRDLRVGNFP